MVQVDARTGSKELKPLLDQLNLKTELVELTSGDFSFEGNGPKGLALIGIERKTVTDLLQCMRDARYVDVQLPRMIERYDVRYLLIEGTVRANPMTGLLEQAMADRSDNRRIWWREVSLGRTRFAWDHWDHYITSLEWAPVKVRRTGSDFDTARHIHSLYHYYRDKQWRDHKSLRSLHYEPWAVIPMEDRENPVRCVARELPGIGVERSLLCTMKWRSVFDMITATREEWLDIPGVGDVTSKKVFDWIHDTGEKRL